MGIKFFIAIAQMLLPFVLGMTVATTAAGLTSYNTLFFGCGIIYIVLLVLVMIFPLPDSDAKAEGKKEGLIASLKHTRLSLDLHVQEPSSYGSTVHRTLQKRT